MANQSNNRHRSTSPLVILIILSSFVQGLGQSQNRSMPGGGTKSDSSVISCPLYVITVEVRIPQQKGTSELGKENFILYDNGVRQDIRLWTRIEASGSEYKGAIYAMAYSPPVYVFDGKPHEIRVVVRSKAKNKLRIQFSPGGYHATKELFG
jgi:hypothetical protein